MELDFAAVEGLRRNHPAWRLLAAEHASLIVSLLEDELFRLRGEEASPRSASDEPYFST